MMTWNNASEFVLPVIEIKKKFRWWKLIINFPFNHWWWISFFIMLVALPFKANSTELFLKYFVLTFRSAPISMKKLMISMCFSMTASWNGVAPLPSHLFILAQFSTNSFTMSKLLWTTASDNGEEPAPLQRFSLAAFAIKNLTISIALEWIALMIGVHPKLSRQLISAPFSTRSFTISSYFGKLLLIMERIQQYHKDQDLHQL